MKETQIRIRRGSFATMFDDSIRPVYGSVKGTWEEVDCLGFRLSLIPGVRKNRAQHEP